MNLVFPIAVALMKRVWLQLNIINVFLLICVLQNGTLGRPLSGVPMVASSPVRHESNLQPNPVEVTSYQPPWKALSEFAMQSELDQPPFHQLVSSFGPAAEPLPNSYCGEDDDDAVVFT